MKSFYGLDIETKRNAAVAEKLWKPGEYKIPGNIKDPVKLQAHRATWDESQIEAKALFIERAALSPLTGQIVVIGLINDEDATPVYLEGSERQIIEAFWKVVTDNYTVRFVFWSGSGSVSTNFDMDFIVTRSRILGIRIPATIRSGRYYGPRIIDLASEFLLYQSQEYLSLSNAGELLGLFGGDRAYLAGQEVRPKLSTDEVNGANFAFHYSQGADGRAKALKYLRNDLLILFHIASAIL